MPSYVGTSARVQVSVLPPQTGAFVRCWDDNSVQPKKVGEHNPNRALHYYFAEDEALEARNRAARTVR